MTTAQIGEADVSVLASPTTTAHAGEVDVSVLAILGTAAEVGEMDVSVLCYLSDCVTRRCQVWKITRRDGVVKAFTSLDTDIVWAGTTYKACASLTPTASESSTSLGDVGSISATGVIDDAGISEADVYAGLYDDAYVDVWLVPWGGGVDAGTPVRLAAGWWGKTSQGETGFTVEVLGPGARLGQAGLVEVCSPGCRYAFGVSPCPVDVEALKIAGKTVSAAADRQVFSSNITAPGGTSIWNGGTVHWLTGVNAGVRCEVDTVDFPSARIVLWAPAPFQPVAGDTFDLLPGCPKDAASCKVYGAYEDFGGEPDVPGGDAIATRVITQ